jgi:SNF family Na+-dependent transporter
MASVETTITSVIDAFPYLKQIKLRKWITITLICLINFLFGLIFTFQSGTYWLEFLDTYAANWSVLLVGAIEAISISWFYGLNNFKKDISIMIGDKITNSKLFYVWYACWFLITPLLLLASLFSNESTKFNNNILIL